MEYRSVYFDVWPISWLRAKTDMELTARAIKVSILSILVICVFLSATTPVVVNTSYVIAHASRGEIEWLDTISSSAAAQDVHTVFLTCSDWSYRPRFEELV